MLDAYNAHLKVQSADAATAANLAGKEIAAQVSEANAIMQYRIAEIGHWYEPDKIMGYAVAVYFAKLLVFDKIFWAGEYRPLGRFCRDHGQPDRYVLFRQAGFRKHRADHQAMSGLEGSDVRAIVVETLAEQQRLHRDDIDAVVLSPSRRS